MEKKTEKKGGAFSGVRLFHKKRNQEQILYQQAAEYAQTGGILLHAQEPVKTRPRARLLICFMKGLIMAAVICGTIGCTASALEIPCNMPVICCAVTLTAVLCSLLYYSQVLYNFGLIAIFVLFCYSVIRYFSVFNSGFSAIVNIITDHLDEIMNMEALRQFTERISDRTYTTTMCLGLIGCVAALIMNSVFSGFHKCSIFFAASAALLCLCFYLEVAPAIGWLCLMLWGYTMAGAMRRSGHFRLPAKNGGITLRLQKQKERREYVYIYEENGKGLLRYGALLGVVFGILALVLIAVNSVGTLARTPSNRTQPRLMLDNLVRDYATGGIMGLFNSYDSVGGVSSGRLGGVRSVTLDFMTDLTVEYVPYTTDRMYLKTFSGDTYFGNYWSQTYVSEVSAVVEGEYNEEDSEEALFAAVNKESVALMNYLETTDTARMQADGAGVFASKMRIDVLERSVAGAHKPYYTMVEADAAYMGSNAGVEMGRVSSLSWMIYSDMLFGSVPDEPYEVTYYGMSGGMTPELLAQSQTAENKAVLAKYEEEWLPYCLAVPADIADELQAFCDEYQITGTREEVIAALLTCFSEEFHYTYSPGKTPRNKDFVTYFLNVQKKGYCVYFASAAVLLLRQNGIPARYCEGYCIDYEDLMDGDILTDEQYEEWFSGYNALGETAVVSVELTDANAHAWVEVYYEGFGWVPLEFTVADMEAGDYSSFWSDFAAMFGNVQNAGGEENTDNNIDMEAVGGQLAELVKGLLLAVLCLGAAAAVVVFCGGKLYNLLRLYVLGTPAKRLIHQYHMINLLLWNSGTEQRVAVNNYHSRTAACLTGQLGLDASEISGWIETVVRVSYSPAEPTVREQEQAKRIYRKARRRIYNAGSFRDRCRLYFREGVWLR